MKNLLFWLVIAVLSINMCGHAIQDKADKSTLNLIQDKADRALHYIHFGDTGCSAYAVGKHTLMTAEHCFVVNEDFFIDKNRSSSNITQLIRDGNDHIIMIISDVTFDNIIDLRFKDPTVSTHVFIFGNPLALDIINQYREGYMSGKGDDNGHSMNLFIMSVIPGDSGSCIFDEQGNILGIVSFRNGPFMGSFPITFSAEQIKQVQ